MNLDVTRQESFGLAQLGLEECTTQYTGCPSYEAKLLPTRVMDMGTIDESGQPPLLVVARSLIAPYVIPS